MGRRTLNVEVNSMWSRVASGGAWAGRHTSSEVTSLRKLSALKLIVMGTCSLFEAGKKCPGDVYLQHKAGV